VRHVLEGEFLCARMIELRASYDGLTPFSDSPPVSVSQEFQIARPIHEAFLERVSGFSPRDLAELMIDRTDAGYTLLPLGDFLLRTAYHEAVHAGQLLSALRSADVPRARIWD
jgi:hypothetical protein